MATADAAAASLGPRYAPDDPTLPKPWKGLIDGSTGVLYYWNPETNVTQYEKPASLGPPLPQGPPPPATVPKPGVASLTHPMQPSDVMSQQGQQQQGQQIGQLAQQQGQVMAPSHGPVSGPLSDKQEMQHQGSHLGQAMQTPGQFTPQQMRPQMMQYPGQQTPQQPGHKWPMQPGQQMQSQGTQMPHQAGQQLMQNQNPQMAQQQGHQYTNHQIPYMAYQQNMPPQGQLNSQQQTPLGPAGQTFVNQQEYGKNINRDGVDSALGNRTGFSSAQYQQTGPSSSQNLPGGTNSVQMQPTGVHLSQSQQRGGSSVNVQPPHSMPQLQQPGSDLAHHPHGPRFQKMAPAAIQNKQTNGPPFGFNSGYEDNVNRRPGMDYYSGDSSEGPAMGPQQPKLAALPMVRNQQETRVGGAPLPNVPPSRADGPHPVPAHGMHNIYGHMGPYPNSAVGPPVLRSGVPDLSPVEAYRQQHEVTATGDNIPAPFMTFEGTGFPPEILREIHSAGFLSPTPIQAQTWPIALQSRDIVAIAKTGSGKTLGYLIPAFMHLRQCRNDPRNGPTVLVLAPTRELATQIQDEAIKFGRSSRVSCTCLYGGAPKGPQLRELDRGAEIVVATPGRLNDILEMKKIDFRQISLLVLDEADRMLDMGFEPQIRKIVKEIPPRRQTLMYTATWPKDVRKIANDLLVNPVQVNIGNVDELVANKSITQHVEVVPQMEKERRLQQILRAQERGSRAIIFCSTKRLCDQLARSIGRNFGAIAIHGDKSQGERDWVLDQFRSGKSPILVATDVAARGLDIKDIRVVINYDFPNGIEDYVHRIGRTGRAGATGLSYTFLSEQDWKHAADLVKLLEGANQHVPPEVRNMAMRGGPGFGKDRGGPGRFDSGGGRCDSGGRSGMRDGGFGGRGDMRDGGFGGRGGMRDGNFGGRGGIRDGGFGGRSGGRSDMFPGRGNRGRGFAGPGNVGFGRNERGPHDRYNNNMDGRGRGRGRGRFDGRRDTAYGGRDRSYSRSPGRVRTWGYSRSRSQSRSRSRSSRSWSRSRSRSWSRDRSRSRSRSFSRSRSRSRSRSSSYDRLRHANNDRKERRVSGFDVLPESRTSPVPLAAAPMSPGLQGNVFPAVEQVAPPPQVVIGSSDPLVPDTAVSDPIP